MSLNYYCYYCQCRIKVIRRPLPACSICLQDFVEEWPFSSSSSSTHIDELSQSNKKGNLIIFKNRYVYNSNIIIIIYLFHLKVMNFMIPLK